MADSNPPRMEDLQYKHVRKYGSIQEGGSLYNKSIQDSMNQDKEITKNKINKKM